MSFRISYCLCLAAALVGCQTAQYRGASLPSEYLAAADGAEQRLQLANLASAGGQSAAIGPGDLLEISVVSGAEEKGAEPYLTRVDSAGQVEVPVVGTVAVAGFEPADAGPLITAAAVERGIYRRPSVTVQCLSQASNRITVLGAVTSPGVYELPRRGSYVVAALAAAGGVTEEAGTEIEVLRQPTSPMLSEVEEGGSSDVQLTSYEGGARKPRVQRIDLAQIDGSSGAEMALSDGDVVMVEPQKKRLIHVTGLVRRPDQFELPRDQQVRVLDAIAMAGGHSSPVADKVYVIRQVDSRPEPIVIGVSIAKAKRDGRENLVLRPGDLVSVETTIATTLVDTLRDFFRITMGVSSNLTAF